MAAATLAWAVAGVAWAEVHERGAYRFETGPEPAFVQRMDVPAQWPADAPGADDPRWRYWLYDRQVDHRGAERRSYFEHVFEVRSPSLLGEAGRFSIDFTPEFERITFHKVEVRRDGRWTTRLDPKTVSLARREGEFEQDIANGAVTALLVLDDVRVGDVIRVSYTYDGGNPILQGQRTESFRSGYHNPTLAARFRALYAPGTEIAVRTENGEREPVLRVGADATEVSMERTRVPAIVDHGDYPRGYSPFPSIQVGPRQQWADVVHWALPLYPQVSAPLAPDLEQRIAAWRRLPTAHARLAAALRTVQDEVRYFGIEMAETTHRPHAPHEVWARRFGDCKDKAYLLVTLLHRLGIEAVPALVSVSNGAAVGRLLPAGDAFDHVIVRATLDGATVWMDPTVSQQGGDPRQTDLADLGMGLPVAPGVTALEAIPRPGVLGGVESKERYSSADGRATTLAIETVYRGASADEARRSIVRERPADLSRRYREYYGKRLRGIESIGLPVVEDDREANVVTVRERYRVPEGFQRVDSRTRSLELYADALSGPTTLPGATTHPGPLRFTRPGRFRHVVEVDAPAAWSARFGREHEAHESAAFEYSRGVEVDGNVVRLTYDLDVKAPDVGAKDVAAHLDALREARDGLSAILRFQTPATITADEREQRLRALLRGSEPETTP